MPTATQKHKQKSKTKISGPVSSASNYVASSNSLKLLFSSSDIAFLGTPFLTLYSFQPHIYRCTMHAEGSIYVLTLLKEAVKA